MTHNRFLHLTALTALCLLLSAALRQSAFAYDAAKLADEGLIPGDLSTWTQHEDSFPENDEISVNGRSPLSEMGCSYYSTFFMLCKMGIMDPLEDTAWEFARDCCDLGLCRRETGYFDPRSISRMTDGRAAFVEEGNYGSYYEGQSAIASCSSMKDVRDLLRTLTQEKGYFCVACCVGTVTDRYGNEYYSNGHYIFIDEVLDDDMIIGDSAFDGCRWSDNWGAHNDRIVKIYCYEAWDGEGNRILPSDCDSMYKVHKKPPEQLLQRLKRVRLLFMMIVDSILP